MKKLLVIIGVILAACQSGTGTATIPPPSPTSFNSTETPSPTVSSTETSTLVPTIPPATVELEGVEIPEGFSLIKFAELTQPTGITFDGRGRMYAASQDGGIYILHDADGDGRADLQTEYSDGFNTPLGVAVHSSTGDVYVSHKGRITILRDVNGDNRADAAETFVNDLPYSMHQNDNLKFGPDGWLYIGVGSTCDACDDPDPRSASILRYNLETGESQIYATGMRNPYDFAFHPVTGELFATDNGRDKLGMDAPFEELNHIIQGGDYGYPGCWNEQDQPGCENTIPAVAFFEAHSSANGVDIYSGERLPAEYRGNAFVSIWGSWLKPNVQTGIQRVVLTPNGDTYTGEASWFIKFPVGVMPLPILFGPNDALYVGDYVNGAIYRISYGVPS